MASFRVLSLEGLRKTMKNLSQATSWSPGQDLNWAPPEYVRIISARGKLLGPAA
jgi:hypothetical protein